MSTHTARGEVGYSAHRTGPHANSRARAIDGGAIKQARVHCVREGGKSPTALLRRALLTTTKIRLGHSYTSSHTRAVLSALPDANVRPSGLKLTDLTPCPCPSSVLAHAPVSTSHSRTVLS